MAGFGEEEGAVAESTYSVRTEDTSAAMALVDRTPKGDWWYCALRGSDIALSVLLRHGDNTDPLRWTRFYDAYRSRARTGAEAGITPVDADHLLIVRYGAPTSAAASVKPDYCDLQNARAFIAAAAEVVCLHVPERSITPNYEPETGQLRWTSDGPAFTWETLHTLPGIPSPVPMGRLDRIEVARRNSVPDERTYLHTPTAAGSDSAASPSEPPQEVKPRRFPPPPLLAGATILVVQWN